jgi:hypothetical protein
MDVLIVDLGLGLVFAGAVVLVRPVPRLAEASRPAAARPGQEAVRGP